MNKIFYTILFLCLSVTSRAQIKLEYTVGYGTYSMKSIKAELAQMQEDIKMNLPLDIVITDNFPGYVTHGGGLIFKMKKNEIGANFTYLTTAGRWAYSDYSGELVNKIGLNAYRIGLLYRNHFHTISLREKVNFSFFGELSPGLTMTKAKTENHVIANGDRLELDKRYNIDAKATNFSIMPQLGVNIGLSSGVGVHLSGGYDIEMNGALEKKNRSREVDWTGIRFGGGISYLLPF